MSAIQKIEILCAGCEKKEVKAIVKGLLAVYVCEGWKHLTHVPTGRRIATFRTNEACLGAWRELSGYDWNFTGAPSKRLRYVTGCAIAFWQKTEPVKLRCVKVPPEIPQWCEAIKTMKGLWEIAIDLTDPDLEEVLDGEFDPAMNLIDLLSELGFEAVA